jgi:hypothetical protein
MILGPISLDDVETIYRRVGLKELVIAPWCEDGRVVGLMTGYIEEMDGLPGLSGFLEHIIILPEAKDKLRIMLEFPAMVHGALMAHGIDRAVLCIHHDHPKRKRLMSWAARHGYTKYADHDGRDWFRLDFKETEDNG